MCDFCERFHREGVEDCLDYMKTGIDLGFLENELNMGLWHNQSEDGNSHSIFVDLASESGNTIAFIQMPIYFCPICGKKL